MKKLFLLFLLMFSVTVSSFSQTKDEQIVFKTSDLTADQLVKIKTQQKVDELQSKIQTYGKWAGVGGEVGTAVREGLNAVVDVSEKFGNTKVGTFTMYLIAWKVVGVDITRIILGLLFVTIATIFILKALKSLTTRKVSIKGAWYQFWVTKEYQIVEPDDFEGIQAMKFLYVLLIAGAFGITYAIMFA